ncbi:MAG TPA: hypothetical protein IAC14_14180 [Candidatus Scybalomonas excrementigallinarum]|nr:hypothetical protein [Candidatus Scybalomonas excrementigallinarum]
MKKIFGLGCLFLLSIFILSGCSLEEEVLNVKIANLENRAEELKSEIALLKEEKQELEKKNVTIKKEKGIEKYMVTFEIKQVHYTSDYKKIWKDNMNQLEFSVMVDKDFFDSIEVGKELKEELRLGSLIMENSFGSWQIIVKDKKIV